MPSLLWQDRYARRNRGDSFAPIFGSTHKFSLVTFAGQPPLLRIMRPLAPVGFVHAPNQEWIAAVVVRPATAGVASGVLAAPCWPAEAAVRAGDGTAEPAGL